MVLTGCCKDQFEPVKGLQLDRCGPVAPGSVRFKSKKGAVWTGCGSWLPLFGGKNRTELDLYTLVTNQFLQAMNLKQHTRTYATSTITRVSWL